MLPETQQGNHGPESSHPAQVTVTVDGRELKVQAGTYTVSDFKALVGVDASKDLDEIIHGEFKPLDDNAKITIEKHEKFVSHVRIGRSS
jgi:uncharacterized protein YabE (DUF348 family)